MRTRAVELAKDQGELADLTDFLSSELTDVAPEAATALGAINSTHARGACGP